MATINWNEKKEAPKVATSQEEILVLQSELTAQKEYNMYLESTVLELADMVLLSSLM